MGNPDSVSDTKRELTIDQEADFLLGLEGREVLVSARDGADFYGRLDKAGEYFLKFRDVQHVRNAERIARPDNRVDYELDQSLRAKLGRSKEGRVGDAIYNKSEILRIYPI